MNTAQTAIKYIVTLVLSGCVAVAFNAQADPRFTNYRAWLSSDYITNQLALDPAVTQKRLGDGFYEQKLIREQVAQLTGRRFLGNYTNDQEQYQALMDSGLMFAKALKLRPGIALTANQAGDLTPQGALLSGDSVAIKTTSDITNAGNIHNLAGLIRRPPIFSKTWFWSTVVNLTAFG